MRSNDDRKLSSRGLREPAADHKVSKRYGVNRGLRRLHQILPLS
jgi:hypothetical protein